MAQTRRPINISSSDYVNRHSNRKTLRSALDGAHHQQSYPAVPQPPSTEHRYVPTTSSSARDVVDRDVRHDVSEQRQPLNQLQHFVEGRRILPDQLALHADRQLRQISTSAQLNNVDGRSYVPAVGVDYSHQALAVDRQGRAGDGLTMAEAEFSRQGAGVSYYRTGYPSHFLPRAAASSHRDHNRSHPVPLRGLAYSGPVQPAAVPLDMSGAKRQRFASTSQVNITDTIYIFLTV